MQHGRIVCPVSYRDACYGTGRADLLACAHIDTLGILLPQKLPELARISPVVGIYIERPRPQGHTLSPEDALIEAHRHLCAHTVHNRPGELLAARRTLLSLIAQGDPYAHDTIAHLS